jgi:Coenzyme PQQ synthesis protein D (PqqD)
MAADITLSSICVPSDDVVAREIESDVIIVPVVAGVGDADDELYTLNDTGRAIWALLDGRHSLADVAALIEGDFEAPRSAIEQDVLGFAQALVDRRILAVRD